MKQESKMVAVSQVEQPQIRAENRTKATSSTQSDQGNESALYKVIGRVLLIVAGLCMLMLYDGKRGHSGWRQESSFTRTSHCVGHDIWSGNEGSGFDTGLRSQDIWSQGECVLFDGATSIYMLCIMVPGGQSFLAYQMVYHGLIKGKADTLKHVIMAAAAYSMCIYLVWKGCLSVDWLFVAITTCVSVVWSTLNNRILHMGDTRMNQVRVDVLLLMGNLLAFNYERFIGPALIIIAEHGAYAATKTAAKTQTWYITSKREDLVQKECLNVELLTALGAIEWLLAYALMLWEGFRQGLCPWPVVFGSYWLTWEFLDGFVDYFNKGSFKSKLMPKRVLHVFHSASNFSLHILFVLYGLGTPFGVANPELLWNRVLCLAMLIAMWMVVCVLCSWYGWSRQIKYYGLAIHYAQHASMVRLPASTSSPLLITAAWVSVLGNLCYVPKICSHTPPPKMVFSSLIVGLVVIGAICNIFRHQLCAIPTDQFIIMTGTWLVMTGSMMIFGQYWKKIEHKNE